MGLQSCSGPEPVACACGQRFDGFEVGSGGFDGGGVLGGVEDDAVDEVLFEGRHGGLRGGDGATIAIAKISVNSKCYRTEQKNIPYLGGL